MSIKQKKGSEKLYFIAIIPPQAVYDQALTLKNYFRDHYQSKAALNSPPHITLHMPFQRREEKENELIQKLEGFAKGFRAGELQLDNFGSFPPRVIFVNVIKNEWIENLQHELHRFCKKELSLFNANYKEHPFHPHITLAFRDLKKQKFVDAWKEFYNKKFEATFPVDEIVLLKHDGKIWNILKVFKLTIDY